MSVPTTAHEFALYIQDLSLIAHKNEVVLTDNDIIHRITIVLRLDVGDSLILFDRALHAQVTIKQISKKKSISCMIIKKEKNTILAPTITFLLPLLKRDALETTLYSLAEIGANNIQLILTHKSQNKWTDKDHERAHKIIIAAAEQSKNFAFPVLAKPVELVSYCASLPDHAFKYMFDKDAPSFCSLLQKIKAGDQNLYLIIGPEGGLADAEKAFLQQSSFMTAGLTPTVLRACQAAAVSTALVRLCL